MGRPVFYFSRKAVTTNASAGEAPWVGWKSRTPQAFEIAQNGDANRHRLRGLELGKALKK
jgi:hypothetical protein